MPYDPQWPQNGQNIDADRFREQFGGLKDFIDAVQSGGITGAVIESVGTGNAGDPASVGVSLVGTVLRFSFVLPRGDAGVAGQDGQPGQNGQDGQPGPQGPPFANAIVDGVTTLNPGDNASVGVGFDGMNVRFTFGIPRGNDGIQGFQGPPGEITQAQLDSAIHGTSANTNGVSTLDSPFADPDVEALRQKLNELILNGRR